MQRMFASDNASGVCPEVMEALLKVNEGHEFSYGNDDVTRRAIAAIKGLFARECEVYFVYNGTGANVLSLRALTMSYGAVLCADVAHINTDETGAPEFALGAKLIGLKSDGGKIAARQLDEHMHAVGSMHESQPQTVSLTQCTERGRVYSLNELDEISAYAHKLGLYVHMDGARICTAAAALKCTLDEISRGVDVLSLGMTKDGMMFGEAVVAFHAPYANGMQFMRKQTTQLHSKMRYIAAQFLAMIEGDVWLKNARRANEMAEKLAARVEKYGEIIAPVEANMIFLRLKDADAAQQFARRVGCHDMPGGIVRLVTSWDTREEEINACG